MQVLKNSTFILPLPYAPAYGNEVSRSQGIQDRQRGDLVVAICPTTDPYCTPPSPPPTCPTPPTAPTAGFYLVTRYVTTVMPHPASTAGLRGYLDFPAWMSNWGLVGQDLAVLEVPSSACAGTYELSVRSRSLVPPFDESSIPGGVDVVVVDAPPGLTNPTTANPFGEMDIDIAPDLAALVPNPTVPIHLSQIGWTDSYPSAVEIDIAYLSERVEILGAYEHKHLGIGSLVRWRDNEAGTVSLSVVDPDRCTGDLRLVFRLRDGEDPVDPVDDFWIVQQRSYDPNGVLTSQNPYVIGYYSESNVPYCPSS